MNNFYMYLGVSILISLFFGLCSLTDLILKKRNQENKGVKVLKFINANYWLHIGCGLTTIILMYVTEWEFMLINFKSEHFALAVILTLFVTCTTSAYIISRFSKEGIIKSKVTVNDTIKSALGGMAMEIPQRLFVQNVFLVTGGAILKYGGFNLAVLLTALVWVQFIAVERVICQGKLTKDDYLEMIASFWFSIVVGIIYNITGVIWMTMIAHAIQRVSFNVFVVILKNWHIKKQRRIYT